MKRLAFAAIATLLLTLIACFALLGCSHDEGGASSNEQSASANADVSSYALDTEGMSTEAAERIEQVVAVMEGELGNTDGTVYEDALLDAGGELCYERGYWCATFIWWSCREAGLSGYFCDGSMTVYPQQQAEFYEEAGRFYESADESWQPEAGDLAFYFYNEGFPGGERISHSEFVISYDDDSRTVYTISANPVVEYHEHGVDDSDVRGFADIDWDAEEGAPS